MWQSRSRGIGFFHTRIFQQFGNEICGVLGTSPVTVKAVESLSGTYGILPKTYINLDQLMINEDLILLVFVRRLSII